MMKQKQPGAWKDSNQKIRYVPQPVPAPEPWQPEQSAYDQWAQMGVSSVWLQKLSMDGLPLSALDAQQRQAHEEWEAQRQQIAQQNAERHELIQNIQQNGPHTLTDKSKAVEADMPSPGFIEDLIGHRFARFDSPTIGGTVVNVVREAGNPVSIVYDVADTIAEREDRQESAAQKLANMTTVDEYLAKPQLSELEREAALYSLNRMRELYGDRFEHYDNLLPEEREELKKWNALEFTLGFGTGMVDRLGKSARSLYYTLQGTPDVLWQTLRQAYENNKANQNDPEYQREKEKLEEMCKELFFMPDSDPADPDGLRLRAQMQEKIEQQEAVVEQLAHAEPLDLQTYGAQRLLRADELQRGAVLGLSDGDKTLYNVGYGIADGASLLPVKMIPVVGPAAAVGIQGAKTAAQEAVELAQRDVSANEALERAALSGGIEIATGMLDFKKLAGVLEQGGEKALLRTLREQLAAVAKEQGGSKGAEVAVRLLTSATEGGLESELSYLANCAVDWAYQDPERQFSMEELLSEAGEGALQEALLEGGKVVIDGLHPGSADAVPARQAAGKGPETQAPDAKPSAAQNAQELLRREQARGFDSLTAKTREVEGMRDLKPGEQAARLAALTQPEDYMLTRPLTGLELQAARQLLEEFQARNQTAYGRYAALSPPEQGVMDRWLALEYRLKRELGQAAQG